MRKQAPRHGDGPVDPVQTRAVVAEMKNVRLNLLPPICVGCRVLMRAEANVPLCSRCGPLQVPLAPEAVRVRGIDAVAAYDGPLAEALVRLKFHHDAALAGPLGVLLAAAPIVARPWDLVVPVPAHWKRALQRGYNVPTLLALALVRARKKRHLRVAAHALRRRRNDPPQRTLGAGERAHNVERAFVARRRPSLVGRRVLIVDDVTTTGATLRACRAAILAAGAPSVGCLALLRRE